MDKQELESEAAGVKAFADALAGEDELGVILRSHLLIEHEIEAFLELSLDRPDELKGVPYGIKTKVALACGLRSDLKNALKAVGVLRNDFAHKFSRVITAEDVQKFRDKLGHIEIDVLNRTLNRSFDRRLIDKDK